MKHKRLMLCAMIKIYKSLETKGEISCPEGVVAKSFKKIHFHNIVFTKFIIKIIFKTEQEKSRGINIAFTYLKT